MGANNQPVLATINARLDVLEQAVLGHVRRRVSRNEKARLMGVCPRTVARHVAAGLIEQPTIVRGRWYFWVQDERGTADTPATKVRDPRGRYLDKQHISQRDTTG